MLDSVDDLEGNDKKTSATKKYDLAPIDPVNLSRCDAFQENNRPIKIGGMICIDVVHRNAVS